MIDRVFVIGTDLEKEVVALEHRLQFRQRVLRADQVMIIVSGMTEVKGHIEFQFLKRRTETLSTCTHAQELQELSDRV